MPSASSTSSLPQQQTAIIAQGSGQLTIQHDAPVPFLSSDMAIVKTVAVAINPADAKMLDYSPAPGAIHGYDFAGTIVTLGADALALGHLAVGNRVAGLVHGMNKLQPANGAFAEYFGATADLLLKVPDHMSFEEAASFGTGVAAACLGLFGELRIPASFGQLLDRCSASTKQAETAIEEREYILIAGGSTATGTRVIQLAKL